MASIKFDENFPNEAVALANAAGHDASNVFLQGLSGTSDKDLSEVCRSEQRVLLTLDTDFANIVAFPPQSYPGPVVFHLSRQSKGFVLDRLASLLALFQRESPVKKLWIVEDTKVRIWDGQP